MEWSGSSPELLLVVDRTSGRPLRAQLEHGVRDGIRMGRLQVGERLPSSRELARTLGLSRGLVQECYAQLQAEGYLVTHPGSATRVAAGSAIPPASARPSGAAPRLVADFRWGVPDLGAFLLQDWLWATREAARARAVVATPAHQWPTGVALALQPRLALLDWVRDRDAIVIEDDYDAEFRYDREPVGALQGLAPDRVIFLGTISKSLAPALRIGWMLCPPDLAEPLTEQKHLSDRRTPTLDQLALARLIESGRFDRHLRRMRAGYAARHATLLAAHRGSTCSQRASASGTARRTGGGGALGSC